MPLQYRRLVVGDTTEDGRPDHGFGLGLEREVQRESEREAFRDVVHEEGHEDGESEVWVCVVGRVGDEAFRELVEGDGNGGLQADT